MEKNGIIEKWFPTIVTSGSRASAPHAYTSSRRIGYGEPVVVDIGPLWMGYDGCVAYTFIVGRNKFWEEVVNIVKQAISEGSRRAKPGISVRILDEVPRRIIREYKLPDYPHLTGHPIGGFYKPVIASFIDYVLEENMAFAYEPAVYIQGRGGVRIEHHVIVTSNGYKILTACSSF